MEEFTEKDGMVCYWHKHSDEETIAAWSEVDGQGNHHARYRGWMCVVVPCNRSDAVLLSKKFHYRFAIESCCHYDGETLSMYCGDAGSGAQRLMDDIRQMAIRCGFKPKPYDSEYRKVFRDSGSITMNDVQDGDA